MKNYFFLYLLLIVTTVSCNNGAESTAGEAEVNPNEIVVSGRQFSNSGMEMSALETMDFPVMVQTTGEIDVPPENRAVINAFVGGYVKRNPLLVGDEVKKGQALVTLENPEYIEIQQEYLEVAEQLNFLKSDFERQETLMEENVTSEKKFLQAQSDYRRNLATYNGLKQKLQMLNINPAAVERGEITSEITIYAPISGSITDVDVSKGMFVSPMTSIMEIVDKEHMHLELMVFEKDVMQIEKGQDILFRTPEATTTSFPADVYLVGTAIDRQSRTVTVHGHLPDSIAARLAVGMFVEASIITSRTRQGALPEEAVVTQDGYSYVLQLQKQEGNDYIFERKEVKPGGTYNGFTAILNSQDFNENNKFLTRGTFSLIGQ